MCTRNGKSLENSDGRLSQVLKYFNGNLNQLNASYDALGLYKGRVICYQVGERDSFGGGGGGRQIVL